MTDTEILDWLEANIDNIRRIYPITGGVCMEFYGTFQNGNVAGRGEEVDGKSIRGCVLGAIELSGKTF